MAFKTEGNPGLSLASLGVGANFMLPALVLAAFGSLLAIALWPQLGVTAAVAIAFLVAGAVLLVAWQLPPWLIMRFYGARPYDPTSHEQAAKLLADLAGRAALPAIPALFVIPSTMLSAFSVGTAQHSAIVLTEGLMRQLTMREIAAVLAREIAHIGLGHPFAFAVSDLVSRCAQVLYYAGLWLAAVNVWRLITGDDLVSWITIFLFVLAPALMNLVQLALPRGREYTADKAAALITGDPLGLASALTRLDNATGSALDDVLPPVPARKVPQPSLLRCPPPPELRVERLKALKTPPMPALDVEEGPRISLVGLGPIAMRPRYRWPGVWF